MSARPARRRRLGSEGPGECWDADVDRRFVTLAAPVDADLVTRRQEGTWRSERTRDRADRPLAALDATGGAEA